MNRARRKTVTVIGAWVGGTAGWVLSQPDVSFSPHIWLILLSLQMGLTLPQVEAPSSCMHTLTWFLFKIPKKECWFSRHSSAQNPLLVSCLIPSKSSGNLVSYCLRAILLSLILLQPPGPPPFFPGLLLQGLCSNRAFAFTLPSAWTISALNILLACFHLSFKVLLKCHFL